MFQWSMCLILCQCYTAVEHMVGLGNNILANFIALELEEKNENILQNEVALFIHMIMTFNLSLPLMTMIWHLNIKYIPAKMEIGY